MDNRIKNYELILDRLQKTCSHIECFNKLESQNSPI
jgi:hypothetical protein